MNDGLVELEELAGGIIRQLGAPERRKLLRRMVKDLRASQSDRIARQLQPDGSPFAPRRKRPEPAPGAYPLKFLYPKGAAEPRLCFMKSWVHQGENFTGYDIKAKAIRTFAWERVERFLPLDAADKGKSAGKLRRRGSVRRNAMFRKLRTARYLRTGVGDLEAWVGFAGRAAAVASIHQYGLRDRPSPKAREVTYAVRRLLGVTEADRERMVESLLEQVTT